MGSDFNESRIRANNKYNEKAYDRINIAVAKGRKEVIQTLAQSQNESLNGFVTTAIDERIARLVVSKDEQDGHE